MKNNNTEMNKWFLLIILFVGVFTVCGQPNSKLKEDQVRNGKGNNKKFEGKINLIQESLEDTIDYTYYVKDEMVRLDVMDNGKGNTNSESYMIFDLKNNSIIAINPSRKMFINVPTKPYVDNNDQNFQIIKSNNNKKIQGYKCYQWRVKNKAQNTEISYWLAKDNFSFFEDFLKIWNRSEKHALYFLQMPEANGCFPMLSEERTILRDQKMTLRVLKISKQYLDPSLFIIPKEYKSYEH